MAGLENINDVVGQQAYDQLERLLKQLDAAANKMIETAKVFKSNPISVSGLSTKEEIEQLNKLIAAQKEYQNVTKISTRVENEATAAKRAKLAAQRAVGDQLTRERLIITNDTAAINQNTAAIASNTAVSAEDAAAHAAANAATARQTPALVANTVAQEANTVATVEATAAQNANNASMNASASGAGGIVGATKGLRSLFGVLRQVAYILPGIGIAGILGGGVDIILDLFGKSRSAAKLAATANKEYEKSINDVGETARKQATEEISNINVLTSLAADNTQTTRTRTRAVKELQETYPETFGALSNQAILEGKLGDAVNITTQALLNRAAAQAAEKKFAASSEKIYDLQIAQNKAIDEGVKAKRRFDALFKQSTENPLNEGVQNASVAAAKRLQDANNVLSGIIRSLDAATTEQKGFLQDAQKSAALAGDLFFKTQPKTKDTSAKELRQQIKQEDDARKARIAAEKEYQDALRDNRNAAAEENIQTNKEIFEDETKSLSERLEAYNEYYSSKQNQANSDAQKELADIVQLESEIRRIEAEDESHRSPGDKALLARKEGIAERRRGIEVKLAANIAEINENSAKDILKIQESYSKQQINLLEAQLVIEEDAAKRSELTQLRLLLEQTKKGKITWAEYQHDKEDLALDSSIKQLEHENSALSAELERTDLTANAKEKIAKQYYDNLDKLRELNYLKEQKQAEEDKKLAYAKRDLLFQIAQDGLNSLSSILEAQGARDKQRTEDEKDQIDQKYQYEIDSVKANGQTQEEQAQAISDLENKRDNEKRQADHDQAVRNRDLAKQQKEITISGIILATSLAIIKAFTSQENFATQLIAAAQAASTGASQLAVAAAAPLPDVPKYKDGTEFHEGGGAVVGDGYVAEWIKEPGKKGYWSPSKPTYMELDRGASVTNPDQLAAMATRDAIRTLGLSNQSINESMYAQQMIRAFESLIGETKGVKKAIGNKPTHNTILTERGLKSAQKRGNSWTSYIDSSVRN